MDGKTRNTIVGKLILGAVISGGMGFLLAILLSEPWHSYKGMIISYAIGGFCVAWWLIFQRKKR